MSDFFPTEYFKNMTDILRLYQVKSNEELVLGSDEIAWYLSGQDFQEIKTGKRFYDAKHANFLKQHKENDYLLQETIATRSAWKRDIVRTIAFYDFEKEQQLICKPEYFLLKPLANETINAVRKRYGVYLDGDRKMVFK